MLASVLFLAIENFLRCVIGKAIRSKMCLFFKDMLITNIAGYKFHPLTDLEKLRSKMKEVCLTLKLKGSILISSEGINVFLAGFDHQIHTFKIFLREFEGLHDIEFKYSFSSHYPFRRMRVRLKKEIITMGIPDLHPDPIEGRYIEPKELKEWYDKGKDFIFLDTRNRYEIAYGAFKNTVHLDIEDFNSFPEAVKKLESHKEKIIVTGCTGGIRCEKAAPYMERQGFKNVFQLKGGILKYFEECGEAHYQGDCFVFDERVSLTPSLEETRTPMCRSCSKPISTPSLKAHAIVCEGCCPRVN